jgi:hypothetical protein
MAWVFSVYDGSWESRGNLVGVSIEPGIRELERVFELGVLVNLDMLVWLGVSVRLGLLMRLDVVEGGGIMLRSKA